jgi:hypothetical protein
LVSLRVNASRLEAGGASARQKEAALLLPLIDAELATRKANGVKPPRAARAAPKKVAAPKKSTAKKKVVVEEDVDAIDSED